MKVKSIKQCLAHSTFYKYLGFLFCLFFTQHTLLMKSVDWSQSLIQILPLLLSSCVTWGKLLNFSVLQFLICLYRVRLYKVYNLFNIMPGTKILYVCSYYMQSHRSLHFNLYSSLL